MASLRVAKSLATISIGDCQRAATGPVGHVAHLARFAGETPAAPGCYSRRAYWLV
jgi:hypothetical protein